MDDEVILTIVIVAAVLGIIVSIILAVTRGGIVYGGKALVPQGTNMSSLIRDIQRLLAQVGFTAQKANDSAILCRRVSPLGASVLELAVRFEPGEARIAVRTRARGLFAVLLPMSACGLGCGITCSVACSCGGTAAIAAQMKLNSKAYAEHLFEAIKLLIESRAARGGGCSRCGTPLPNSAKYCRQCGAVVS